MAAPVRIEASAFADPRIDLLGQLAGYSRFEALGRLAHLWSTCTERQLYVVPEAIIRATIGPAGVQHMLDADLAEPVDGGYRIRGLAGRIEWLGELREKRARAGQARQKGASRDHMGRMLAHNSPAHAGDMLSTSPAPASTCSAQSSASTNTSTPALSASKNQDLDQVPTGECVGGVQGGDAADAAGKQDSPGLAELKAKVDKATRRTQMPDGWVPSRSEPNVRAESEARARGVDLREQLAQMRDWAKGTAKPMADWDATWRNWLRRSRSAANRNQQGALEAVLRIANGESP